MEWRDELGFRLELDEPPQRIVSLVPSLTETLFALGLDRQVVGVTKFCVEPAGGVASIEKIGGTKNPDLRAIAALQPDLVIANAEENRQQDVERMRARGLKVFVTYPRTVSGALESILGLGRVTHREPEAAALAREIVRVVSVIETSLGIWNKLRLRVFCPIWKKPWMTFNEDTYAHDVLRMLGFLNVFGDANDRYPRTTLQEALDRRVQVMVLPDEPYAFGDADVAELKAELPSGLSRRIMLISGRDLHWYGVHMIKGLPILAERLGRLRASITPAG
ncbi:MAG TPA: helical backbone metal receptor [Candidatus Binataceae bacterium]|jgi:ABC-type Fe3+-hydroxamate transport system substrate-binding protein|nr:helical backbone metal receptor [Candidatus Binataceae bacterium]